MADILFARIAEKIQFGLVGPKDSAVLPHPVHPNGRIVHKVTEVRFAPPEGLFDFLRSPTSKFRASTDLRV